MLLRFTDMTTFAAMWATAHRRISPNELA